VNTLDKRSPSPLEFSHPLGLPADWAFTDVWGLDDELLAVLPQPVRAMVMLFPVSDVYEKRRLEEDEKIRQQAARLPDNMYFTRQTIGNACGTIGVSR